MQLYIEPWRSKGVYELADSNLPAEEEGPHTITLDLSKRKGRSAIAPLPFTLDSSARARVGRDLTIRVDGRELRYTSLGGGSNSWRLKGDQILLQVPPKYKTAELEYRGVDRLVQRRIVSKSGLPPSDYVVHDLTLDGHTRHGLVLTSPSTISWSVQVPAKRPVFDTWASLDPAPFAGQQSDGMEVVLEVRVDDSTTEVGRRKLSVVSFDRWQVELDAFAGKQVELVLRTEATGSPDFDFAFLGSPTLSGAPTSDIRRVLVIGMDTTRPDHFGWYGYDRNTTPEMDAIANQSAVFTQAFTPAPRTRPSFRAATTGRNPLDAVGAKNIGAVFQDNGYATKGLVANIHLQPRFGFDDGFDSWQFFGKADANEQVDRALEFFEGHSDRDTYLFLHFMDPHLRYSAPGQFRDFFVTDPDPELPRLFDRHQVLRWTRDGTADDRRKAHIEALYDGEIRFMSQEIGRLVDALDQLPGKTLIVIHSDHGEEFWEHGGYEHNHTLYTEVTNAVLWIRPPGGTKDGPVRVEQPATLADIGPTLFDFAGIEDTPKTDGISLRPAIAGTIDRDRDLGIAHLRYGLDRWAVVHDRKKYIVATGSGEEELYDLVADPREQNNLAPTTDLTPFRAALPGAHPGLEAGMGWRITIATRGSTPITLSFPKRATGAGVIDPENLLAGGRANKAWGEKPRKTPEDVGEVALAEDGLSLTLTPGSKADGVLWVRFDEEVGTEGASLALGDKALSLEQSARKATYVGATGTRVTIEPGMIVVPPPDEAARMRSLAAPGSRESSETCQLCQLGYIVGEACCECGPQFCVDP